MVATTWQTYRTDNLAAVKSWATFRRDRMESVKSWATFRTGPLATGKSWTTFRKAKPAIEKSWVKFPCWVTFRNWWRYPSRCRATGWPSASCPSASKMNWSFWRSWFAFPKSRFVSATSECPEIPSIDWQH